MRKILAALLVAVGAVPVSGTTLHYTLQNVVFLDGGVATGSFDYTFTPNGSHYSYSLSNLHIETTSSGVWTGHTYDSATSYMLSANEQYVSAFDQTGNYYVGFQPVDDIASFMDGGTVLLDLTHQQYSFERYVSGPTRNLRSGAFVADELADPVPEPAMLGLFGMGAIGLGLSRRRRAA